MKIAVMNFSGNVGKTTVAGQLLKPRMPEAQIFSIESINSGADADGLDVDKMKGNKYAELIKKITKLDSAIIDVGASNVEDFLKLMQQHAGSHEDFDYFLIPTAKEKKVQMDTINTIQSLKNIGIEKEKILLVFNKLDIDESALEEFAALFGLAAVEDSFIVNAGAVIYSNEVYDKLKTAKKSLLDVTNDPTNYRAQLKELKTEEEKDKCIDMIAIKRLAITANKNLDDVYKALFS